MSLLEQEISELVKMNKLLYQGKIPIENVSAHLGIYRETANRAKMLAGIHIEAAKHGKKILTRLRRTNLIGDNEAVDMGGDFEVEMVKCPEKDGKVITRAECLDFSGTNMELCTGCVNKTITQDRLLGKKE